MYSILEITEATDNDGPELITLEALKAALGITTDTEDAALNATILSESTLIAAFAGRQFAFAHAVETFYFDTYERLRPNAALALSLYPVDEVDSITVSGGELDLDVVKIDKQAGLIFLPGGSWSGTVIVTYSGGYQLPDEAPAGLVAAIIASIEAKRAEDSGDASVSSVAHGDTRVTFFQDRSTSSSGLTSSVIELIRPFCRPVLA